MKHRRETGHSFGFGNRVTFAIETHGGPRPFQSRRRSGVMHARATGTVGSYPNTAPRICMYDDVFIKFSLYFVTSGCHVGFFFFSFVLMSTASSFWGAFSPPSLPAYATVSLEDLSFTCSRVRERAFAYATGKPRVMHRSLCGRDYSFTAGL